MSRRNEPRPRESEPAVKAPARAKSLSDSILVGPMKFAGMVATTNGYAVAFVELSTEGELLEFTIGNSQKLPQYVAPAAKAAQAALAQEVQLRRPGKLT